MLTLTNMEQGQEVLETKSGHKYSLVEKITAREGRRIGLAQNRSNNAQDDEEVQNEMIRVCVTSLDGSTENVLERMLDLSVSDYLEILTRCTVLFEGISEQKKS